MSQLLLDPATGLDLQNLSSVSVEDLAWYAASDIRWNSGLGSFVHDEVSEKALRSLKEPLKLWAVASEPDGFGLRRKGVNPASSFPLCFGL